MFYPADVSKNKAEVLVNRVNIAYGTDWKAVPESFTEVYTKTINASQRRLIRPWCDILISCVDTAQARKEIHYVLHPEGLTDCAYWLDCGNLSTVGHAILGQPGKPKEQGWPRTLPFRTEWARWTGQKTPLQTGSTQHYRYNATANQKVLRLPCVTELYPALLEGNGEETEEPSCSMVAALRKQSLFVNRTVSSYALDLLWELIREGGLGNQGVIFNLRTRVAQPVPLKVWPLSETKKTKEKEVSE